MSLLTEFFQWLSIMLTRKPRSLPWSTRIAYFYFLIYHLPPFIQITLASLLVFKHTKLSVRYSHVSSLIVFKSQLKCSFLRDVFLSTLSLLVFLANEIDRIIHICV